MNRKAFYIRLAIFILFILLMTFLILILPTLQKTGNVVVGVLSYSELKALYDDGSVKIPDLNESEIKNIQISSLGKLDKKNLESQDINKVLNFLLETDKYGIQVSKAEQAFDYTYIRSENITINNMNVILGVTSLNFLYAEFDCNKYYYSIWMKNEYYTFKGGDSSEDKQKEQEFKGFLADWLS